MAADKDVTPMLVFAIFSAVLGMFQFGFNTGVINAPQKVLEEFIANVYKTRTGAWITEELRDLIWSVTVSVFAFGGMIGGLFAPMAANWCGRKTGLVLNNALAVLGVTLLCSSQPAHSIECLILGRFFIGLNCGLSTALVPMYLSEIATVSLRGALGTVSQLGVTLGLLMSQVLGLKDVLGTKELWPFLFGFAFVPALLQLVMLPFCPESPRYLLLSRGRVSEARQALRRLRATADVDDDMEEMRAEERSQQEEMRKYGKLTSIRELINTPWLRAPLIIGVMMQLSQQLSGINAIFYYSTDIFLSAEVPETYAVYATMGVGLIMVITTLVSIPLMDRLGRRTLHLQGLAGMFLASIFLTISLLVKFLYDWMKYISVFSILSYTLFFGIGPGSIPLMITAELFTQGTRPAAMSVSVLSNWFANFVVGLTFPLMKRVLQSYLFLPFTLLLAIFWIFTYKKLPETKNRTFDEIAALFRPLQLDPGAPGPSDYGCNVSNLADSSLGPAQVTGSGAGPALGDPGMGPIGSVSGVQHQLKMGACCSRETQGNLGCYLAHNSCTSIAQNLSTSDQQPLIVDAHLDSCHYSNNNHCNHHHRQQHQRHHSTTYNNNPENDDLNENNHHDIEHNNIDHRHRRHHVHQHLQQQQQHMNHQHIHTTHLKRELQYLDETGCGDAEAARRASQVSHCAAGTHHVHSGPNTTSTTSFIGAGCTCSHRHSRSQRSSSEGGHEDEDDEYSATEHRLHIRQGSGHAAAPVSDPDDPDPDDPDPNEGMARNGRVSPTEAPLASPLYSGERSRTLTRLYKPLNDLSMVLGESGSAKSGQQQLMGLTHSGGPLNIALSSAATAGGAGERL